MHTNQFRSVLRIVLLSVFLLSIVAANDQVVFGSQHRAASHSESSSVTSLNEITQTRQDRPDEVPNPNDDGFYFEDPRTNCTYTSQPYIYDAYLHLAKDMFRLFDKIHPQVDFTIMGHHPVSGHYHDLRHVYVNAFWRLVQCFLRVYPEEFDVKLLHIHGGCDVPWSVQEVRFKGRTNNGRPFYMVNVWVTKWLDGRMVEVRTFMDGPETQRILYENELWTNSTTETDHQQFVPGPAGMPDETVLARLAAVH